LFNYLSEETIEVFAEIVDSNSDFFFEDILSENQRLNKNLFSNIFNNYH
jgi:hypothetical protein